MERYTINISFKTEMFENVNNIVEKVKTMKEAMSFKDLIDDTVDRALIKDNVTGKVTWLKKNSGQIYMYKKRQENKNKYLINNNNKIKEQKKRKC